MTHFREKDMSTKSQKIDGCTVKIHPQLVDVFWPAKLARPVGRKKIRLPTVDVIFQYFHNVKACGVDVSVESKKGHELIDVLKKPKKSI